MRCGDRHGNGQAGWRLRTDEVVPGHRFNTQSAAHNIINATGIVEELGLRAVGLEYREKDPFSIAVHRRSPGPRRSQGGPDLAPQSGR